MKKIVIILLVLGFLNVCHASWDLMISEVYLKGNADRIEISNIGDEDFEGILTLSGATTPGSVPEWFDLDTLTILSGKSTVVTRYGLDSYSYFGTTSVIGTINSRLTLSATGRYIQLLYQGSILDDFLIDYQMVKDNDATKSFIKTDKSGPITVSTAKDSWNVAPEYYASPGVLLPITLIEPIETGIIDPDPQIDDPIVTGLCIQAPGLIQVSEIFLGNEKIDPFIEIKGLQNFDEPVMFSGSILGLSFTNQVKVTQDGFLLISRGANGLLSGSDKILEPSLELISSSGTILLLGQNGQVLDKLDIQFTTSGQSTYLSSGNLCQNTFSTIKNISPGFDDKFLIYFTNENVPICPTVNSCPICSSSSNNPTTILPPPLTQQVDEIQINQSDLLPENNQIPIQILDIDLSSNIGFQTITLKSNLDSSVSLSNTSKYRIHSTNRSTNNVIGNSIDPGQIITFTGNRRFPKSDNCIELLSGTEVLDTFCYGSDISQDTITTENNTKINTGTIKPAKMTTGEMLLSGTHIVSSIIDGDTFRVKYKNKTYTIRMIGIDSPESSTKRFGEIECGGKEAKQYLTDLIKGKYVKLEFDPTQATQDIYGRRLAYAFLDGENVNQKMIQNGYAREYTYKIPYLFQSDFKSFQKQAENKKLGMWHKCGSGFQTEFSGKYIPITGISYAYSGLRIEIKNIIPNPKGNDKGREEITFLFDVLDQMETSLSGLSKIDLGDGFYLLIGSTKKKLKGIVNLGEETTLTGTWSLPNKATCVSIGHGEIIFDKICYEDPVDNKEFTGTNYVISSMSTGELAIINKTKMQKINDKICIVYGGQIFDCQNLPASKTSIKLKNENKLYKNYFSFFEDYLKNDWKVLFYNTTIQNYFNLFYDAKKTLKKGSSKITIGKETVDIFDLHSQFILKYLLPSLQANEIILPENLVYKIPSFEFKIYNL